MYFSVLGYTGVFSGLFILRQNLPQCILKLNNTCIILNYMMRLMKINFQINKKLIKINKQRYLMCLLGIVGRPGVIRLTLSSPVITNFSISKIQMERFIHIVFK